LLESYRRDDSDKWSNIAFGEEKDIIEIKIHILSEALQHILEMETKVLQLLQNCCRALSFTHSIGAGVGKDKDYNLLYRI